MQVSLIIFKHKTAETHLPSSNYINRKILYKTNAQVSKTINNWTCRVQKQNIRLCALRSVHAGLGMCGLRRIRGT